MGHIAMVILLLMSSVSARPDNNAFLFRGTEEDTQDGSMERNTVIVNTDKHLQPVLPITPTRGEILKLMIAVLSKKREKKEEKKNEIPKLRNFSVEEIMLRQPLVCNTLSESWEVLKKMIRQLFE